MFKHLEKFPSNSALARGAALSPAVEVGSAPAAPARLSLISIFPISRVAARTEAFCEVALMFSKLFEVEKHYK